MKVRLVIKDEHFLDELFYWTAQKKFINSEKFVCDKVSPSQTNLNLIFITIDTI